MENVPKLQSPFAPGGTASTLPNANNQGIDLRQAALKAVDALPTVLSVAGQWIGGSSAVAGVQVAGGGPEDPVADVASVPAFEGGRTVGGAVGQGVGTGIKDVVNNLLGGTKTTTPQMLSDVALNAGQGAIWANLPGGQEGAGFAKNLVSKFLGGTGVSGVTQTMEDIAQGKNPLIDKSIVTNAVLTGVINAAIPTSVNLATNKINIPGQAPEDLFKAINSSSGKVTEVLSKEAKQRTGAVDMLIQNHQKIIDNAVTEADKIMSKTKSKIPTGQLYSDIGNMFGKSEAQKDPLIMKVLDKLLPSRGEKTSIKALQDAKNMLSSSAITKGGSYKQAFDYLAEKIESNSNVPGLKELDDVIKTNTAIIAGLKDQRDRVIKQSAEEAVQAVMGGNKQKMQRVVASLTLLSEMIGYASHGFMGYIFGKGIAHMLSPTLDQSSKFSETPSGAQQLIQMLSNAPRNIAKAGAKTAVRLPGLSKDEGTQAPGVSAMDIINALVSKQNQNQSN